MMSLRSTGPLVIIGGGEDRRGDARILRELVRLAGGPRARLLVIPAASGEPAEIGRQYAEAFSALGADRVDVFHIDHRDDAQSDAAVDAVEAATGVFFTGGDQVRVTRLIGGTRLDTLLHARHDDGLVIAGTSAGACIMSTTMILEGLSGTTPRAGVVELGPGMEFISGVIIDQHFFERGRLGRLLSAVAQYPRDLGVGIDENTALVVRGSDCRVLGTGAVTVIDAGAVAYTNVLTIKRHEAMALCGVRLHVLPEGYGFDLRRRVPILEGAEGV